MANDNGNNEMSVRTPLLGVTIKGKHIRVGDIILILILMVVSGLAVLVYAHDLDSKVNSTGSNKIIHDELKLLVDEQKKTTKAQRFNTCIVSYPEKERKEQYINLNSLCHQLTDE